MNRGLDLSNADGADKDQEQKPEQDPLLVLAGSGAQLWSDEHADEYVRRLREDWD